MRGAIQEKRFEYKGFPCVVVMQALAFRTGYVGLPKTNKFYGVNFMDIPISCHGGLTYSENHLIDQTDNDIWWIGFDTGHYGDGMDYKGAIRLFKDYPDVVEYIRNSARILSSFPNSEPIRTLKYCENECREIVDQLLDMEE